jgi:preprotein translocase subunit SecE
VVESRQKDQGGVGFFDIYKRGQGRYTRIATFVGIMVIVVVGAGPLSEKLGGYTRTAYVRFGIPALVVALMGLLMFWVVNRPKSADFMISTEGEMKKVSWSSRKEVVGSTKVVIITTFIVAALLFGVDLVFQLLFGWVGILR